MAFDSKNLDDYVDVAQRIADFRAKYPLGCLQPVDPANPWEQATVTGYDKTGKEFTATLIVYKAAAYRYPGDDRPGIGVAWEPFPGRTPYTTGSELMNAETSAWGRAIIAVLASDSKRGVASREEVRNRNAERDDGLPVNADGSLSRSRTTDEQKAQAGVMTAAQDKAHSALQPKKAEQRPAQRLAAVPDDDPFYDTRVAEDRPNTATADQIRDLNIWVEQLGYKDRAAKLRLLGEGVGRALRSSKDLSYSEAAALLKERDLPAAEGGDAQ